MVNSFSDLMNLYIELKKRGNTKINPENIHLLREYTGLRQKFGYDGIEFLESKTDFIIIEAENGVLGFSPEGKEIFREIPAKYEWRIRLIEMILNDLGEF